MKNNGMNELVDELVTLARVHSNDPASLKTYIAQKLSKSLGPTMRVHASTRITEILSNARRFIGEGGVFGREAMLKDIDLGLKLVANSQAKKPSRRKLASLLATLRYSQYANNEEHRRLIQDIDKALEKFDTGTGEWKE